MRHEWEEAAAAQTEPHDGLTRCMRTRRVGGQVLPSDHAPAALAAPGPHEPGVQASRRTQGHDLARAPDADPKILPPRWVVGPWPPEPAPARRHRPPARVNSPQMRLPNSTHTSRPWRIHELTRDFQILDVWELPGRGDPDDFPRLVALIAAGDPSKGSSRAARALWAIRWKVGKLLGWDDPDAGLGSRVPTLRDRLPAGLRDAPAGPDFDVLPFTSLYLLEDEWAAEIANRTMHGVLHLGWAPDGTGGYRGQMAVLVKPNGLLGTAYLATIRPFRRLIVYPAMLRTLSRSI
jgi:hypothetical protein